MKNSRGFTLIEVILTLSVLGLIVTPLMSMLVMSARINFESDREYKSFLAAQSYMEEIKTMGTIDYESYAYDHSSGAYERVSNDDEFVAEIKIVPESSFYYTIDISILDNNKIINTLRGSMLVR